jgi:UDPglucose--hexose-1-phosphate uridylyltransferase
MRELRKDPVLNRWVIIASERSHRPQEFDQDYNHFDGFDPDRDPFREGNEHQTPPEIYAIRPTDTEPNSPGWKVRVIPNKFPALRIEGDLNPRGYGLYDRMNGVGAHEVVIESPDPLLLMTDMSLMQVSDVFATYRHRLEDLSQDKRFAYVLVFKNHGRDAGASLRHAHSQIIATPMVPKRVMEQLYGAYSHWKIKRRSIFVDIVDQEMMMQERVVYQNKHVIAICPYASSFPFEVHIYPKRQLADFRKIGPEEIRATTEATLVVLKKWRKALGETPYNYLIHTAPNDGAINDVRLEIPFLDAFYCWHMEMFPRIGKTAGFEWGTGYYINPTPPEEAAKFMRNIEVEAN